MKFLPKPTRRTFLIALLWAGGVAVFYRLTPEGPREGWQPPPGEVCCGFLEDDRTMVTAPHSHLRGSWETGPISLWDMDTGKLRASHFGRADIFSGVLVHRALNMLCIEQRASLADNDPWYYLRLVDAPTGTEKLRFKCCVPKHNVWWIFSKDGRTTAFVTWDDSNPHAEAYDVLSGRRSVFPGCREALRLSPDGSRLAACRNKEIVVLDVPSGREIARCRAPAGLLEPYDPNMFSADGTLLLDSTCSVWDVDAGTLRFSVPNIDRNASMFSPDGKWLIVVEAGDWLVYYDTTTGEELVERRRRLSSVNAGMLLNPALPDSSRMIAFGYSKTGTHDQLRSWLAKVPHLRDKAVTQRLFSDQWEDSFVLLETATGREISHGNVRTWTCSPDGRYTIRCDPQDAYEFWDIPPKKPLRSLAPLIAGWSLILPLSVVLMKRLRRFLARE